MKKYRLLKDLSIFKAGEIFKLKGGNLYYYPADNGTENAHWSDKIMAYHHKTLEKFPNILEEWFEEVEEPKEHWMIDVFGDVDIVSSIYTDDMIDELREIGNYFETKKEAKKAVAKLKAWKKLKDLGAKFNGYNLGDLSGTDYIGVEYLIELDGLTNKELCELESYLDLLFGGEE